MSNHIVVVNANFMCFKADSKTLQPLGCSFYDPYILTDMINRQGILSISEWNLRRSIAREIGNEYTNKMSLVRQTSDMQRQQGGMVSILQKWADEVIKTKVAEIKLDENALNKAAWEFIFSYRKVTGEIESAILFNRCKAVLRPVIEKYIEEANKND